MAVVTKNPLTERARTEYFNTIVKMKYALAKSIFWGEDTKYLLNLLVRQQKRLDVLEQDSYHRCENCGKPSLDFMSCEAKQWKENCKPKQDPNFNYDDYWDHLELPIKPSDDN